MPRSDGAKSGRPPFDLVFMFKVLLIQASPSLSDERTEYLIKDRLSFMRLLALGLADLVPGANTIWTFREALTRARLGGVTRQSGCDLRGDQDETDRIAALVIMAGVAAMVQAVSLACVAARQSAKVLTVARVGGRPGPRLRSSATLLR